MIQQNTSQTQSSMAHILEELSRNLARYLEKILPSLFEDWWNEAVVNILSFQQQRRVKEQGISSIAALDLAALVRVLDQNWYQISTKMELPSEARHFVKEMQTVRNRWAHVGSQGFPADDIYRDLDTLQRFAIVVEADKSLLEIYQRLIHIRQENPHFYFMPRRRKDARLKKGYWFLGNEHYLAVSFWSGTDTMNRTPNISFSVIPPQSNI